MPSRRAELYPRATDAEWGDWRWQLRHSVRSLAQLEGAVALTEDERRGCVETADVFRLGISPYYLSLIDPVHPYCPVRMQAIPVRAEAQSHSGELRDPLGEDKHRPVRAIVHKYPDRVLLLALDHCSVYCRHCTRRRITSGGEGGISREDLREAIAYLREHGEVRDVLISGGDPLLLSTERLVELLEQVRSVPHVEIVRIGTRIPVCLPMRVDDELAAALRRFAPLYVVTHFNHAKEITAEAREACERLVDRGIPVENQAVLMRRVNSSARAIKDLMQKCLAMRVRPYYLHQMDVAEGLEHLRTPLARGIEILRELRGWTSGLAVPHLAVDLPGGGGKVTLQPDYVVERCARETVFRNYRGERFAYPEPYETDCSVPYDEVFYGAEQSRPAPRLRVLP
ncbi:MAG TPA: KamA family radical SAM protein [Myxococcales bacterium]|jgi:lysine 2,3-aminomutase|nr:KamA family radical SAM protein [Myxococcales bacterium]